MKTCLCLIDCVIWKLLRIPLYQESIKFSLERKLTAIDISKISKQGTLFYS